MILNYAHRGSLTEAPENTIPAFQKAINSGAKAIELDVQLSKDNELIVCHDHTFTRFNKNIKGRLNTFTLADIKQIDVGSSFSKTYRNVSPPTLAEVLEICPKHIKLNIEIKNIPIIHEDIEHILIDCLDRHQLLDHVIISSFDHVALKKVQELAPQVELGMLFYYRILNAWDYAAQSGLNIKSIHPNNVYTDREFVESCKNRGYKVYPYTVNSKKRYEELLDFGVDGVFSNNPEIFGELN